MPVTPRGTTYTLRQFTTATAGDKAQWFMDDTKVGAKNIPVIVYCHGNDGPYNQFSNLGAWSGLRNWLMDNGFAVVESDGGGPSSWGNDAARTSYTEAFNHLDKQISVGKVTPLGRSMGGLISYWLATQSSFAHRVPALIVNSGTTDLAKRVFFNSDQYGATALRQAWPEATSIERWLEITVPYDPMKFDPALWAGKSVLQLWGTDDPSVPSSWNAEAWVAKYGTHAANVRTDIRVGGDHSGTNGSYLQVSAMTSFLSEFVGVPTLPPITPPVTPPTKFTNVYRIENMYITRANRRLHELSPTMIARQ